MKGIGLGAIALVVLLLVPAASLGQGLTGLAVGSQRTNLPGFEAGFARCIPSVGFGYERVGLNFSLPTSASFVLAAFAAVQGPQPLDVRIAGAHVCLGEAGLDAQFGSGLSGFSHARCSFPKGVTVESTDNPRAVVDVAQFTVEVPLRWENSTLKMWEVEGGFKYSTGNGIAFVGGVRYDKLSVDFKEPGSPEYNLTALLPDEFNPVVTDLRILGDIRSKLWIPFVGAAVEGPNYRGSILWSPWASANVDVPLGLVLGLFAPNFTGIPFLAAQSTTVVTWKFSVFRAAAFAEGKFEYDHAVSPQTFLTLWLRGTYLDLTEPARLM